jgi:hypothetical protein
MKNSLFKLPNRIEDSDIYIAEPFCIFEINNIFDTKFYDNLISEFPPESEFKNAFEIGKKNYLNNESIDFFKFLKKKDSYNKLYNYLNNPEIFKKIYNLLKTEINKIDERKNFNKFFLVTINNKFIIKVLKYFMGLFNIKIVKLGFEFSIIKSNCYIPLHTDKKNKLISLMVYLPDLKKINNSDNWGTCFFKFKDKNQKVDLWDSKFMNEEMSSKFLEHMEKFYQSPFTANKLIGFLKTNNSFHKIEKILEKNALRKSININYYIQ